jgi:hypothetical protein
MNVEKRERERENDREKNQHGLRAQMQGTTQAALGSGILMVPAIDCRRVSWRPSKLKA